MTARFVLVSWNVRGPKHANAQLQAIAEEQPDVVVLLELPPSETALRLYTRTLSAAGLPHEMNSYKLLQDKSVVGDRLRRKFILVASRWPLEPLAPLLAPWPERCVPVLVHAPFGAIELYGVHMPIGMRVGNMPDWRKVETYEALYERLARRCVRHRLVCGDFNAPKTERASGPPETWAFERYRPPLTHDERQRWRLAELNVLVGLAAYDLADAFRTRYGPAARAASWYARSATFAAAKGRDHAFYGRRFDHVFCSTSLRVTNVVYRTDWIERGWSDHAGIVASFNPEPLALATNVVNQR
jgi:exonuclease III